MNNDLPPSIRGIGALFLSPVTFFLSQEVFVPFAILFSSDHSTSVDPMRFGDVHFPPEVALRMELQRWSHSTKVQFWNWSLGVLSLLLHFLFFFIEYLGWTCSCILLLAIFSGFWYFSIMTPSALNWIFNRLCIFHIQYLTYVCPDHLSLVLKSFHLSP